MTDPTPYTDEELGKPFTGGLFDPAEVARLVATVDALRAQRDDPRHIADPNDRCPECGGYGLRGCGSIWHDGRPDTHCSTVCQCRTDDRALIRELAADLGAARADRVCWRETHNQVAAERDALQEAVRRLTAGYELTHHSDGAIWWRRDGWLHATPAETEAVVAARRALDASPTEGTGL